MVMNLGVEGGYRRRRLIQGELGHPTPGGRISAVREARPFRTPPLHSPCIQWVIR